MKKILWCVFIVALMTGCAGPRYTGSPIGDVNSAKIVIINDKQTRSGFQDAMESWLSMNNYDYIVAPEGSKYDFEKINLEYVGKWSWDLALFMSDARISAYHEGQRVGYVQYEAPNSLNANKFGNAEERIGYMMDVLFRKKTIENANYLLIQAVTSD
jgi:hypothetical protein